MSMSRLRAAAPAPDNIENGERHALACAIFFFGRLFDILFDAMIKK
jgi:hypothetical protein